MGFWVRSGTLSIANGETAVTGALTAWDSTVRAGDLLFVGNNPAVEVGSVESNTGLTLVEAWPFTTVTDGAYAVAQGLLWNDVTRLANDVANALANATEILSGTGVPADTLGADGSIYFRQDVAEYYAKANGAWGTAISIVGPTGATGAAGSTGATGPANSLGIGTVTTGNPGSSAAATITGTAPSQTLNLTIPAGATGAAGATGLQGSAGAPNVLAIGTVTTADPGDPAAATITGTSPAQTLNLTIPQGATGSTGSAGADGATYISRGDYDSGTAYAANDTVLYLGSSWLALQATTGNAPPSLPTTSDSNWQLLAQKGIDGSGSVNTVNGQTGIVVLAAADIGDADTPTNYTPAAGNVQGHLQGIDTALALTTGAPAPPQGRLTLTSGVAVTTADVTGGTSIYYTPAGGLSLPLYDGTRTKMVSFGAELTLALDATSGHTGYHQSGKNFDLFIYNDAGTIRLGTGPAWSSDTTRGTGAGTTELELKNGFFVNKNSMTLRFGSASGNTVTAAADQALYVGTFRATADGQASDTKAKRLVFNAYNQSVRSLFITEAASTWNYSTGTWRQTNANTANMVEVIDGLGATAAHVRAHVWGQSSTTTFVTVQTGIGIDSSTVVSGVSGVGSWNSSLRQSLWCFYDGPPGLGYHQLRWLEVGAGVDTQTWRNNTGIISGLSGWIAG